MLKNINKKFGTKRGVFWSTVFAFIFILLNLLLIDKILTLTSDIRAASYVKKVNKIIDKDLQSVSQHSQAIVDSGLLNQYIKNNDSESIIKIIETEKAKRGLDMMMTINDQGVVLSRAEFSFRTGDYILQNKDWGSYVANGHPITIIEIGTSVPLIISAVTPIIEEDKFIGAINVAIPLDNKYIQKIKDQIGGKPEILLYSKEHGLTATTLAMDENSKGMNFLMNYFNTGFNIASLSKDKFLSFDDRHYRMVGIEFPGIKKNPGGILLAIPNNYMFISFLLATLFAIFIYFVIYKYLSLKRKSFLRLKDKKYSKHFIGSVFLLMSLLMSLHSFDRILDKKYTKIGEPPFVLYNSVLKITPEKGILDKNFQHRFTVTIKPGGEAINAIGAVINYDPQKISVLEIVKTNSICRQDMFIEQSIDNELGQVRIACVLPDYQPSIKEATVAELSIKLKKTGSFELNFDENSSVLAADGLGTDVLRMTVAGFYQVQDFKLIKNQLGPVLILSSSHPNSNRWYNRKEINISITPNEYHEYAYSFDQNPYTVPDDFKTNIKTYLNFQVNRDGVYYFHIRSKKENIENSTNHFKIMIDSTPPELIEKYISQTTINTGEVVRLTFEAQDEQSGIQSTYIKIDNNLLLPVDSPIYITIAEKGNHQIMIRTFDNANNFTDDYLHLKVKGESIFKKIIDIDLSSIFD